MSQSRSPALAWGPSGLAELRCSAAERPGIEPERVIGGPPFAEGCTALWERPKQVADRGHGQLFSPSSKSTAAEVISLVFRQRAFHFLGLWNHKGHGNHPHATRRPRQKPGIQPRRNC